ncbi:DsbA family protein [Deinococcus soli (ex Cha et al. 2016)]|uniref:DsbA family protein n=1 Tax=Deinococcus soli (ex Cha et al. 2016) TaxID=1309411 RepID=UPI00166B2DD7|nr:thioredoxin domain-containing protein [Deinococcus soli (ex Cha et al. 2016)]GGB71033.1 hypothetical protein GCM10008019_29020 [Deinococcus soli (ex Cha et al. 2016)]
MTPAEPRDHPTQQRRTLGLVLAVTSVAALAAILFLPNGSEDRATHVFNTDGRPVLGDPKVGAEIVLFSDYKCPNCQAFERTHLPLIEQQLVRTGQAHVVFLHSPFLAPDSRDAARSAECAFRQGNAQFLKVNAALYARQGSERDAWATPELLRDVARDAGLNLQAYDACLRDRAVDTQVQLDLDQHKAAGMKGTPTVFVNGVRTPAGVSEIREAISRTTPPRL